MGSLIAQTSIKANSLHFSDMQISKRNPMPANIPKTFFLEVGDGCTKLKASSTQLCIYYMPLYIYYYF